jgi:nucleoside-diphosphate-sugar epimerase
MKNLNKQKFCILGRHGFLGSALERKIIEQGGVVSSTPEKGQVALFNFASPTHVPFAINPDYHIKETVDSFVYLVPFCRDNKIHFVWPSSALVYEFESPFARLKMALEELQFAYTGVKVTGLRIFPVYGINEEGRGHPTAIHQWCKDMKKGKRPVVYGDGTQIRDFIYVDDVVDNVLDLVEREKVGMVDIGAGKGTSFNEIIKIINKILKTDIKPEYIPKPSKYPGGIICQNPVPVKVSLTEGIGRVIQNI